MTTARWLRGSVAVLVTASAVAAQQPASAGATVLTVGGDELHGQVTRANGDTVWLAAGGGERALSWSDVERIDLGEGGQSVAWPTLWLRSGQQLPARLKGGDETVARFELPFTTEPLELPWRFLRALRTTPTADVPGFDDRVTDPAPDVDLLYAENAGEVRRLSVTVTGIDGDRLAVRFGGQERTVPLARVRGIVFAQRHGAPPDPLPSPRVTVIAAGGRRLTGKPVALDGEHFVVQMAEGPQVAVDRDAIAAVEVTTDKLLPLTELTPQVEQTPALDLAWPPLVDRGLEGDTILLGGHEYRRGLVLFPRTTLTYRLPRPFDVLNVTVGIEDRAGPDAKAICRIEGDGRVLWESKPLTKQDPPQPLQLDVHGVEVLVLEADFGGDLELGDACAFAHPQLVRR